MAKNRIIVSQAGEGLKVGYRSVSNSLGKVELSLSRAERKFLDDLLGSPKGRKILNKIAQGGFDVWGESIK
jgi:hypothetical protein